MSDDQKKSNFRPFVPSEKIVPEMTAISVLMGLILAVVFGAANAYLGIRVGMTISASVPAAVISMGIFRGAMQKESILESNFVQTVGSSGESLAAGAIFTLPAIFLWAKEGRMDKPEFFEIVAICIIGGLLGVFFMIPLRNALIVKEHSILPYPEGEACAEVLIAGEKGGSKASTVFAGAGIAAVFKFLTDGVKVIPAEINSPADGLGMYKGRIGTQINPAVFSVGYICGPKMSSYIFAGGLVSWLVLIPLIVLFGSDATIYPGTEVIAELFAKGGVDMIWSTYIRYIGAGALAAGGLISFIKIFPVIIRIFKDSFIHFISNKSENITRTEKDMSTKVIVAVIGLITLFIAIVPTIPIGIVGAIIIVLVSYFFAAVSARMVGLVGSSNNPVSGMTIAALLFATVFLKMIGKINEPGMKAAITIGTIICIVCAISGDISQDLKTGYLVGATPVKQQYGEILGVIIASFSISAVLFLFESVGGYGTDIFPAPQAVLMKMIVEGVMGGKLPWALVFSGAAISICAEIAGITVLPFAVGIYLPIQLSACIMAGGFVRYIVENKKYGSEREKESSSSRGILYCSGMIAGEGLVGIVIALLAVGGFAKFIDLSKVLNYSSVSGTIVSIIAFLIMIGLVFKFVFRRRTKR